MAHGLEFKIRMVKNGESKIFKNWAKYGLITEEEFIEALKWICDDPLDEKGRATREIALHVTKDMKNKILQEENPKWADDYNENNLKGHIIKVKRIYNRNGFDKFWNLDENCVLLEKIMINCGNQI